ncbi:MAG: hypothetical protein ACJA2C_001068 [Marinoscillum sp.]|jgi:hypothetical protein
MKILKNAFILIAVLSLTAVVSCGGDDTVETETQKEVLVAALTSQTWTVDATATNVSNVTGAPDKATFSITFAPTAEGVSYSLGGDINDYISGGSFSISEEGSLSAFVANTVSTDLSASVASITVNAENTAVTMTINVSEASARVGGIGQYVIVFSAS